MGLTIFFHPLFLFANTIVFVTVTLTVTVTMIVTVTMLHEGVVTAPGVLAIIRDNFLDIINQQSNTKNADNSPGFMTFRKCFYYIQPYSHKRDFI